MNILFGMESHKGNSGFVYTQLFMFIKSCINSSETAKEGSKTNRYKHPLERSICISSSKCWRFEREMPHRIL